MKPLTQSVGAALKAAQDEKDRKDALTEVASMEKRLEAAQAMRNMAGGNQ
jgi:hypothetical protein